QNHAGQRLVTGLSGLELTDDERILLRDHVPAGVILFARNIATPYQVTTLVSQIRAVADPAPTIWIDQEGGRVQRLRHPLIAYPPAAWFGTIECQDAPLANQLLVVAGQLCGLELAALGIGINCAPVLDIATAGADPVIGDRAFGHHPDSVARRASQWLQGLQQAGVMAVGKHFPGHGAAQSDSHKTLPIIDKSAAELSSWELQPFQQLLLQLPALMTAHLVARGIDALQPATCSAPLLLDLLRGQWHYEGLIVSDALEMGALSGPLDARARQAIQAGCDLLLCCTGRTEDSLLVLEGITQALQQQSDVARRPSSQRIDRVLTPYRYPPQGWSSLLHNPWYHEYRPWFEQQLQRLGYRPPSLNQDPTSSEGG
ncbi:MAG: beta-N-acetylhexosaminidase, partial [Magnetococcales bacterium]|nr:beta-N-acetylhexosaminidase [Magnetococcales bacterium]